MHNNRIIANFTFIVLCAISISTKSFAEPPNIHNLRLSLISYHDSGEYLKDISKVADEAKTYILQQIKDNAQSNNSKKLAIVLDVDETSLSYYDKMVKRNFCYNPKKSHEEILTASAPAIEPILKVYQTAINNNIAVFFVTARTSYAHLATARNLKHAGYNKWSKLYLRTKNYKKGSIANFKTKMREIITHNGYTIIASIGDQESDLEGGFAQKTFKLPNPYYYIS